MRAQDALQVTLDEIRIREVVEETVKSMLVDVELAMSLEKDLMVEEKLEYLQRRALASDLALQETRLVQKKEGEKLKTLADELVKELWTLSQELGRLKRWKRENEDTIQERDQLVAKLLQAEEQIEILQSMPVAAPGSRSRNDWNPMLPEDAGKRLVEEGEGDVSHPAVENKKQPALNQSHPPEDAASEKPSLPVVCLDLESMEVPQLPTLEESILLHIFAYLDALEIVQLAQVSLGLYSRVDSLFGMTSDEPEPPPVPSEIEMRSQAAQPTIVQLPPPRPAATPTVVAPPEKKQTTGGVLSLFQTHSKMSRALDNKAKADASKHPLSAAMANSMAEKLSDQEVNAIISMTQKLSKRNNEVELLTQQNMELRGKLDGTEAVKTFLVNKVREIEQTLQKSKELESKTAQQIASDQEVIAFLDSRVQELEFKERKLTAEAKAISDQHVSDQLRSEKKITVLSDMLRYERERATENERDWKATRKVLVKEIKSCRGIIMALQAEKDGLHEQNERLKRAVMSTGVINGSPMRGDRL